MTPHIYSLYSGSVGNSYLIRTDEGAILLDAGKNTKKLCEALALCNTSPEDIRAIFITHEHGDHIGALPVFLKRYPVPVHIVEKSAYALRNAPAAAPCLRLHTPVFTETVCGMTVRSFPTPHDSEASVGYRIDVPCGEKTLRLGYATDIGHVSPAIEDAITGCDAVILESNHDLDMLHTGPYPPSLKQRIASRYGHLSNADSASFAERLCETGTKSIMLAHLSQENNTPEEAIAAHTPWQSRHPHIHLSVASPDRVTELITEGIL